MRTDGKKGDYSRSAVNSGDYSKSSGAMADYWLPTTRRVHIEVAMTKRRACWVTGQSAAGCDGIRGQVIGGDGMGWQQQHRRTRDIVIDEHFFWEGKVERSV